MAVIENGLTTEQSWQKTHEKLSRKIQDLTWSEAVIVFSLKISDPEKCDQMYESLARINSNMYKEKVSLFCITHFYTYHVWRHMMFAGRPYPLSVQASIMFFLF